MTGAAEEAIVREMHVDAAPSDVFPYFAEAEKLAAWKAVTAQARAVPGGTFRMDVTGRGDVAIGSYVEVDPPHRVVFTWAWEGDTTPGSKPGLVEVTLTPDGDGTLVRLIHRGVAPENQQHSAAGWAHYLDRLARAVSGQDPGPECDHLNWPRFGLLSS
jgi:uncharacterized protein YndB with AHSA1/START domain